jgi:hypothetical protein
MYYEKIVREIVAFATEKQQIEFEKFVKNNQNVSDIYGEFIVNRHISYIADYNYVTDDISLKLYRDYSGHAFTSVIHELMHRIWYKLMTSQDKSKWEKEFEQKRSGDYKGEFPGFPSDYSKTETIEYHAEVLTKFIETGKKYSKLIDEII